MVAPRPLNIKKTDKKLDKKKIGIAALIAFFFFITVYGVWAMWPDTRLSQARELQAQMEAGNKDAFEEMKKLELTPEQRSRLGAESSMRREKNEAKKYNEFFALAPADQARKLELELKQELEFQKKMEERRANGGGGKGNRGGGPGGAGQAGGGGPGAGGQAGGGQAGGGPGAGGPGGGGKGNRGGGPGGGGFGGPGGPGGGGFGGPGGPGGGGFGGPGGPGGPGGGKGMTTEQRENMKSNMLNNTPPELRGQRDAYRAQQNSLREAQGLPAKQQRGF